VCTRGSKLGARCSFYTRFLPITAGLRSAGDDSWPQPRYSLTWYIAISRIPYRHMTRGKYYCYKRLCTLFGSPLFK
jgi:hypothetical protein